MAADEQVASRWQQRVAVGAAGSSEAAAARLAAARSRAEWVAANQSVAQARQAVAVALGLPGSALADAALPNVMAAARVDRDPADSREAALRNRPDVRAALADYAAAQELLRLELARQYPDLHLGPGYQWDQGASKWSLGLSFEWPVLSRNLAAIEAAEAAREVAAARFDVVQAAVLAGIERAEVDLTAAGARREAIRATLAADRAEASRLEARVTAGAADRLELALARRNVQANALAAIDADRDEAVAWGALAAALQQPFAHQNQLIATQTESSRP